MMPRKRVSKEMKEAKAAMYGAILLLFLLLVMCSDG